MIVPLAVVLAMAQPNRALPKVIHHQPPSQTVDVPDSLRGCDGPRGSCPEDSSLARMGCDRVGEPSPLLGALTPALPIAPCYLEPFRSEGGNERYERIRREGSVDSGGGLHPVFVRYVVVRDGELALLIDDQAVREAFAPIESAEEALAFAAMSTGYEALYGHQPSPALEYFVDVIEDAHSEALEGGFRVHLFHVARFGCGPKPTSAVELRVSRDGAIEEIGRTPLFKNPRQDRICVD